MYITAEQVRKRIAELASSDNFKGKQLATCIAVVMLPAAGRSVINHIMSYYHGMTRALTSVTRPMRQNETDGADYHFCKEFTSEMEIIEGTQYTIGETEYGLSADELISKLLRGTECVVSVSARGAMTLRQILGDNLFVAYVRISHHDWLHRLQNKFHNTPLGNQESNERKSFGIGELQLLNETFYQDQVIDATFDFGKPDLRGKTDDEKQKELKNRSSNPEHLAQMIHSAADEKRLKSKKEAA